MRSFFNSFVFEVKFQSHYKFLSIAATLILWHQGLAQIIHSFIRSSLVVIDTGVVIQELTTLVLRRMSTRLFAHEEGDAQDHDTHECNAGDRSNHHKSQLEWLNK